MTPNPRPPSPSAGSAAAVPLVLFLLLLLLTALAPAAAPAGALTPEEVPNPLPGGWVVDVSGTLSPDALDTLNREADRVHAEGLGQLAVVVVPATEDGDSLGFALRLFDHWGIGDAEKNDGVLLFLSVGDRAAEIVLGEGVDDPRRQAASDRIMQSVMVPRFREGATAAGLIDGARAISRELLPGQAAATPAAGDPYAAPTRAAERRPPDPVDRPARRSTSGGGGGGIGLVFMLVVIAVIWLAVRRGLANRRGGGGGENDLWEPDLDLDPSRDDDRSSRSRSPGLSSLFGGGSSSSRSSSSRSSSSRSSSRPSSFGGGKSRGGGSSGRW